MKLSPDQIGEAKALRGQGWSWDALAAKFACAADTVRRPLDPEFKARRAAGIREAKARRRFGAPGGHTVRRPADIPPEVLDDRERRRLAVMSPSAELMGDPPPGRSALDLRNGARA